MNCQKHIGQFTSVGTHNISLNQTSIMVGSSKRVRLVGIKVKSFSEIKIVSSNPIVVSGTIHKAPFDGPKGIWTVDLKCRAKGSAKILAKFLGVVVAVLDVEVVAANNVGMPILQTETNLI